MDLWTVFDWTEQTNQLYKMLIAFLLYMRSISENESILLREADWQVDSDS